jgi:hypothetical protein
VTEKLHHRDQGRKFELFGRTYKWVLAGGRYTLKKVGKK